MRIALRAKLAWLFIAAFAIGLAHAAPAAAFGPTLEQVNARSKEALQDLFKTQPSARNFANRADAILVIPGYSRAGFIIGGGYGMGAMMKGGRVVDHYEVYSGSLGLQLGYMERDQIIMFMTPAALQGFTEANDWEFGVDASFAVIDTGLGGQISVADVNVPVIVFMNDARGLMGSFAVSADQYHRVEPETK